MQLKLIIGDTFNIKLTSLFYLPLIADRPLFSRIYNIKTNPNLASNFFSHSFYLQYALRLGSATERAGRVEKAALAYSEANFRVELS